MTARRRTSTWATTAGSPPRPSGRDNSITTGQVYQAVITKEREGRFLGRTVQVIPHITDEIKARIIRVGEQPGGRTLVEVGGTVGDIESCRSWKRRASSSTTWARRTCCTSTSRSFPRSTGGAEEQADAAFGAGAARDRDPAGPPSLPLLQRPGRGPRRKISLFTNVEKEAVISAYDVRTTIYDIPLAFTDQKVDAIIIKKLGLAEQGDHP